MNTKNKKFYFLEINKQTKNLQGKNIYFLEGQITKQAIAFHKFIFKRIFLFVR